MKTALNILTVLFCLGAHAALTIHSTLPCLIEDSTNLIAWEPLVVFAGTNDTLTGETNVMGLQIWTTGGTALTSVNSTWSGMLLK